MCRFDSGKDESLNSHPCPPRRTRVGTRHPAERPKYLFEFVEVVFRFHRLSVEEHYLDCSPAGRELLGVELQKDFPRVSYAIGDRWIVVPIVGIAKHCAGHLPRFDRFRLGDDDLETIGGWRRTGIACFERNHDSHNDQSRVRPVVLLGLKLAVADRSQCPEDYQKGI